MFDYAEHEEENIGSVWTGKHSIDEFEVYKVKGVLHFIDHEDPSDSMTYNDVLEFFKERGDELGFHKQMMSILIAVL